jgi:hypothetical protein
MVTDGVKETHCPLFLLQGTGWGVPICGGGMKLGSLLTDWLPQRDKSQHPTGASEPFVEMDSTDVNGHLLVPVMSLLAEQMLRPCVHSCVVALGMNVFLNLESRQILGLVHFS